MTRAAPVADEPVTATRELLVAVTGITDPSVEVLQSALSAGWPADDVTWQVVDDTATPLGRPVAIVVTNPAFVTAAKTRWPAAGVIALVPMRDDGTEVVAALAGGASVCMRGTDARLIAAYAQAIARRTGLLDQVAAG